MFETVLQYAIFLCASEEDFKYFMFLYMDPEFARLNPKEAYDFVGIHLLVGVFTLFLYILRSIYGPIAWHNRFSRPTVENYYFCCFITNIHNALSALIILVFEKI